MTKKTIGTIVLASTIALAFTTVAKADDKPFVDKLRDAIKHAENIRGHQGRTAPGEEGLGAGIRG